MAPGARRKRLRIVEPVQHAVGVDGGDDALRPVRCRPPVHVERARHARTKRAERAGDPADAAAGDAVERAVEGEERARVGVRRQARVRREGDGVAHAGGDAQEVGRAVEERPVRDEPGTEPRTGVRAAEVELHGAVVVRPLLRREILRREARELHLQRGVPVHEHACDVSGRPARGEVEPASARQREPRLPLELLVARVLEFER